MKRSGNNYNGFPIQNFLMQTSPIVKCPEFLSIFKLNLYNLK